MAAFDDLLTIQEHDNAIDRLRVRREKLPEREQLEEFDERLEELERRLETVRVEREDALRDEKRLDDAVGAVEERKAQVEADLYSGRTSSPKELQALQAEIEQFGRQVDGLEDQELVAIERREALDRDVDVIERELGDVRKAAEEVRGRLAEQEADIDGELTAEREARGQVAAGLPDDLLGLYEQIRERNRGVGAARLVGGSCQACHLALPAVEVDRIKKLPDDALVRCEQCGAILVR